MAAAGTQGQPQWDGTEDADFALYLSQDANYAALVGNRKRGTSAERTALTGTARWEGLEFFETDTGNVYIYTGGSWSLWPGFTSGFSHDRGSNDTWTITTTQAAAFANTFSSVHRGRWLLQVKVILLAPNGNGNVYLLLNGTTVTAPPADVFADGRRQEFNVSWQFTTTTTADLEVRIDILADGVGDKTIVADSSMTLTFVGFA